MLLTLPHTGIRVSIARITFATAVAGMNKGNGIKPDYFIKSSFESIKQNVDKGMQYALELIKTTIY